MGYIRDMSNSTTRFSDRVEDYVKYRPHYPEAVIDHLRKKYSLTPEWDIADIGSGTGISAELFLRNGNRVYGVEPNRGMREKAEELLGDAGGKFVSIDATAESTGLPECSIDLIVAGQAFHWFDPIKSRAEFTRILRSGGIVVLLWNERLIASPFEKEYEDLILRHASDYNAINHKNISDEQFKGFFHPAAFALGLFPNEQLFDFEGLKGRLLSSSYIPKEGPRHMELMHALRDLFDRHAAGGRVRVGYDTKVYSAVLKPSST
jgi:SAM-dependent methyltransferase